jgi:hypothetical protein
MQFPDRNKCSGLACPHLQGTSKILLVVSGQNHTVNINILNTPQNSTGLNWAPLLRNIVVGALFKLVAIFHT